MSAPDSPLDRGAPALFGAESPHSLVLRWLVPLRFFAAVGQALALLFASQVMRVELPFRD